MLSTLQEIEAQQVQVGIMYSIKDITPGLVDFIHTHMQADMCAHIISSIYATYVFQDSAQETETTPGISISKNLITIIVLQYHWTCWRSSDIWF